MQDWNSRYCSILKTNWKEAICMNMYEGLQTLKQGSYTEQKFTSYWKGIYLIRNTRDSLTLITFNSTVNRLFVSRHTFFFKLRHRAVALVQCWNVFCSYHTIDTSWRESSTSFRAWRWLEWTTVSTLSIPPGWSELRYSHPRRNRKTPRAHELK